MTSVNNPVINRFTIHQTVKHLGFSKKLLDCMDTEWDKNVLRIMLSHKTIGLHREVALKYSEGLANIREVATNEVVSNLVGKKERLETALKRKYTLLYSKRNQWTPVQVSEYQEAIEDTKKSIETVDDLLNGEKQNLQERIDRKSKSLVNQNRLKLRKFGSGRKRTIDENDEIFLASCLAERSATHERSENSTLWIGQGRQLKARDLLRMINHNHKQRNMPLVKSQTAVYNRSRPKHLGSNQAKNHIGLGLFCCKKPQKCKNNDNLLNLYCRATKNMLQESCALQIIN